ncbi:MAG: hypothetical protein KUG79_19195 [Pseudomonadales bacterium]|nr:hypothetical protein [Pseudomonadales bacterium]
MNIAMHDKLEDLHSLQRPTILRVYNYYRILLSFLFLWLFLDDTFHDFVGAFNPRLFQYTILVYLFLNILTGLSTLVFWNNSLYKTIPSFTILVADIIGLVLLIFASGGVSSGLGNFLIFTVAFGGGLIHGKISTVLPALAFILTIYFEFHLFFLGQTELRSFFQAGILGIVYFGANIFFQSISRQLRIRESEVFSLEKINQHIVAKMRIGVTITSTTGEIKLINSACQQLLFPESNHSSQPTQLPQVLQDQLALQDKAMTTSSNISFQVLDNSPSLLATFSSISTREQSNERLIFIEDSTEVQRQAQQLKLAGLGRLSASIAHEIRNPLGAISHAAQLLGESKDLHAGDQRLCDIIQNNCLRTNNVIENVLQMSRRKHAQPTTLQIRPWLKQFFEDFSASFSSAVNIEFEYDDRLSTICFDPAHLVQIFTNLSENGLRYSKKVTGTNKLKITTGIDIRTNTSYLEVIDYGKGVDDALVDNLFEPFYTTESSGTGLGLYLSRELCEANNAHLNYSRTTTMGSCFRISIRPQKEL